MTVVTFEQGIVFAVLAGALVLFMWGRWRYDLVAVLALLAVTVTGIVPADEAFLGFGHPAVITVAAVLVVSRALANAGIVDFVASVLRPIGGRPVVHMIVLTVVVVVASGFMNNIGALAIVMPVAVRLARKHGYSPSFILMPLAFGSLLGGLTTLIGTPPNLIIASYRADAIGEPFGMFAFTPVGAGIAAAGTLFVALVGWRLLPHRETTGSREDLFEVEAYTTELRVPEESPLAGKALKDVKSIATSDVLVASIVRGEERILVPSAFTRLRAGDVLVVEADPSAIQEAVQAGGFALGGTREHGEEGLKSADVSLVEAVVTPQSALVARTVREFDLRRRHGVNLIAVSRRGSRVKERLADTRFEAGDVLLLQGSGARIHEMLRALDCLPLAERGLRIGQKRRLALSTGIFATGIAATAAGLLPFQVAFALAALGMVITNLVGVREVYEAVDWPIIILLGAFIPVGGALEATGGSALIADQILRVGLEMPAWVTIAVLMAATMLLSDVVNNAAAAVIMAPIAIGVALGLGANVDPFLMTVAVGASSTYLTPIGHQSNTLVMGPGGYRFGDYWRMGLPLDVVILLVGVPLILTIWPL